MCPFVEEKEKSVMFSLTYKYLETAYTIFSTSSNPSLLFQPSPLLIIITMSNPPIIPTPSIIWDSRVTVQFPSCFVSFFF